MKKLFSIVFVLVVGIGGYYFWFSHHPDILIQISESETGKENLKTHIAISEWKWTNVADSVELKMNSIVIQHEFVWQYLKDNYKASDIKLDMEIKDNQTVLNYYGTVTDTSDKVSNYKNEAVLNFVLDANIT